MVEEKSLPFFYLRVWLVGEFAFKYLISLRVLAV